MKYSDRPLYGVLVLVAAAGFALAGCGGGSADAELDDPQIDDPGAPAPDDAEAPPEDTNTIGQPSQNDNQIEESDTDPEPDPTDSDTETGTDTGTDTDSAPTPDDDEPPALGQQSCTDDDQCADDEACTQGGRCVNVTGERDATAVLQADIDELPEAVGMGVPYRLPANAILQLNDLDGDGVALTFPDKVILEGQGSLLEVENGTIGIRLTQGAGWSMVRDMRINPQTAGPAHDGIGIDVRAHGVRLDNIKFWQMGTGVRAYTTVDGEFANVNSQQWSRLVFRHVHHRATDLAGGDANAGVMLGLEVVGSGGIRDRSFLGNTYIGPTMEGTHTRSLHLESNAGRSAVFGAYVELGDPDPISESQTDIWVGGNAIGRLQGPADRIGDLAGRLRFRHPGGGTQVQIPGHADSPIGWRHPEEEAWWYLRYFSHPSYLGWGFAYENTGTMPLFWTGADHPDGPALIQLGDTVN